MRIFLAGGSGAIGRFLVPLLIDAGHTVVVLTRSAERARALDMQGASAVIGDVFDVERLARLVADTEPEVVIHQLTAFGATDRNPLAETIRIRTDGTRNLVGAAQAAGAKRFVAQSISFICSPDAAGLTTEDTPLYLHGPDAVRPLAQSIAELERHALNSAGMPGIVLRYGWFYGPGTNYDLAGSITRSIRKGRAPIVGDGAGVYSLVHVADAARATVCALNDAAPGIYNIVDDDPARLSDWLPLAARLLNAPDPPRLDEDAARRAFGDLLVHFMTRQPGASNAKAKSALGWRPQPSSWREGFEEYFSKS